jgi:hypothetical protein
MKESIKTQPEVMIVVGQACGKKLKKTMSELAGLLGVERVVESGQVSEALSHAQDSSRILLMGLYSEWKANPSIWPTVDGRRVYLGLLAEERPPSQELFEALDKSVSFVLLKELPLLAQIEAFGDLFS